VCAHTYTYIHTYIYIYISSHLYLLFRSLSPIFLLWILIWILNKTLHKIEWIFRHGLCSTNKMIKKCLWFRVWNPAIHGAFMWNSHYQIYDEASNKRYNIKDMIIAWN
jgi:hypothetical protein